MPRVCLSTVAHVLAISWRDVVCLTEPAARLSAASRFRPVSLLDQGLLNVVERWAVFGRATALTLPALAMSISESAKEHHVEGCKRW